MNSIHKKIGTISIPVDGAKMIYIRLATFIFTVAKRIAIDLIIKNPIGSSIVHSRVSFTTGI